MAPHGDPIAELVLTVLSQTTNDRNRDVAYPAAARALAGLGGGARRAGRGGRGGDPPGRHLEGQVGAHPGDPAGDRADAAADRRARRRAVARLAARACRSRRRRDYLTALPGVGRKTAACVLLFAYGLHDVPVDTHVSRVGTRLRAAARRARRSRSCTTRCSRSRRRARSSSCTSTCCATAGAPATPARRRASAARWRGCARAAALFGAVAPSTEAAANTGRPAAAVTQPRAAARRRRSPRSASRRRRARARGRPRGSRTRRGHGFGRSLRVDDRAGRVEQRRRARGRDAEPADRRRAARRRSPTDDPAERERRRRANSHFGRVDPERA